MSVTGKINIEHELMTVGIYDGETRMWHARAGEGPWRNEPFDFGVWVDIATGYTCAIKRNHGGAWCGYVYAGNEHPIHTADADEDGGRSLESGNPVWLDVHGGVTWHSAMEVPDGLASGVAIGFDCAHYGDLIPGYMLERNHPDPINILRDGEYRTARYVIEEVRRLAQQIADYRPLQQMVG